MNSNCEIGCTNQQKVEIFKGDDTAAFGGQLIRVNLVNPHDFVISRLVFVCNSIIKTFDSPVFPLIINLTSEETLKLSLINVCYFVAYDEEGRQWTFRRTFSFNAKNGVLRG